VTRDHTFRAVAFVENFSLKDLAQGFPSVRRSPYELHHSLGADGDVFMYPFGAVVFRNVPEDRRLAVLARLNELRPGLSAPSVHEELIVREDPARQPSFDAGTLTIDHMTPDRAGIIALIVGQSASMEYYERIVDDMFVRTGSLVEHLEQRGTMPMRIRPLHRFIGEAVGTRSEVLSVLHFLDKPDATWDDPAMDRIYDELRSEFDLVDRHAALEHGLRSIQEALELVLDVARDRRLFLLEASIVALIVLEILLSFLRSS
jgi:uncharacterized Rmd1/YagE family protein